MIRRIRELRSDDLEKVANLWNEAMAGAYRRSSIDKDELEALTLDKQTFDRKASFVAEAAETGKLAGFIISFADQVLENDGFWHMIVAGWIGALVVGSSFRGRGLGSQLLEEAEKVHKNKGRLLLLVGGGEGRMSNVVPGLEEWVDAKRFFEHRGYHFVRRTCFVNMDMSNYTFPQSIKAQQRELEAKGVSIGRSRKEEEGAYERFCLELKRPEVGKIVERWRKDPGAYIVARAGSRIVGEVSKMYITEEGKGGYGAITTLPEFRRRGTGKVMLATPFLTLFPPEWVDEDEAVAPVGYGFNWWGQFVARDGRFHERNGRRMRETGTFPYAAKNGRCEILALENHLLEFLGRENQACGTEV